MTTEPEFWYRFEDDRTHIRLRTYRVLKHTPTGVWLDIYAGQYKGGKKRFVKKYARSSWAKPTVEAAWESFLIRKRRQVEYLSGYLDRVKRALARAKLTNTEGVIPHDTRYRYEDGE